MSYPILKIEGIGPANAKKLQKAGVLTTARLLERAKDPKGRRQLAADSGVEEKVLLKWANMADLMRIKGVGEEYSELLEAAGVDTVKELKNRKAANLHDRMVEVNAARKLVRVMPGEAKVTSWVEQAKSLPAMMTY